MTDLDIHKVAIIGAGPAGICAAKHLHHNKYNDKKFNIVVYEKQDQVGGLWVYNKWDKSKDEKDISPMRKDLIVNTPYQACYYPDFPFPNGTPMFPSGTVMLKYLQNYAKHFDVEQFIKFNTEVTLVSPNVEKDFIVSEDGSDRFIKWKVESKDLHTGVNHAEVFDAVVMCNGLHWTPNVPSINGMKSFKGRIVHSKFFDDPLDFENQIVIIYGYGSSAIDIVATSYTVMSKVYISSRSPSIFDGDHPENVFCVPDISKINDNGEVEFVNGLLVKADAIILCTGYLNDYPSLSPECQVDVTENGKLVSPIYKHMFHAKYPSLVFGGLVYVIPTCNFMHQVSAYITAIFSGNRLLPSQNIMLADIEREKERLKIAGKPLRSFHTLALDSLPLANELAELSGEEKNAPEVGETFLDLFYAITKDFYNYRSKLSKKYNSK